MEEVAVKVLKETEAKTNVEALEVVAKLRIAEEEEAVVKVLEEEI